MKREIIRIILVILFLISITLWFGLYARTEVADYDIKATHYTMDTKFCPYCGEKLEGRKDE